mgnify:CR=1 FL=1
MKYAPPIGMEAQGEDAHYVDGNPELGILGSPVPAAAVEQGQREILEVIKQAGLTPSSEDLTQLFQAIGMLIGKRVPIATKEKAGIVKPGAGMEIKEDGTLNVLVSVVMPGVVVAFSAVKATGIPYHSARQNRTRDGCFVTAAVTAKEGRFPTSWAV